MLRWLRFCCWVGACALAPSACFTDPGGSSDSGSEDAGSAETRSDATSVTTVGTSTQGGTTGPSTSDPSTTGPSTTDPSDPSTTGPSTTDPSTTDSFTSDPSTTGMTTVDPTSDSASISTTGVVLCPPDPNDNICIICLKTNCCDEWQVCEMDNGPCTCVAECLCGDFNANLDACLENCGGKDDPVSMDLGQCWVNNGCG